ncbi:MAG TPA: twin-arginine translocation signal domain-containing protein [Burkholderiales bacterium]|jgi:hypothetical protein|nr:twin-arginine translocation signal domain-containing protein [Burkholderiales bacterium]
MNRPDRKLSRRNFLLAAGAGGVAATAAVIGAKTTEGQPKKAEAVSGSKGYHVTEHIRKYYNTAKV